MSENNQLLPWVEKYRPDKLVNIISQDEIINTITNLLDNNKLPHMLLHGQSGTGKTSSIIAIARKMYGDNYKPMILELNGSDDRGINIVREKIKQFAGGKQLFGDCIKLVILDEADSMTFDAQSALRRIIEKYTFNARFCLICNYANKIIPALRSRCMEFRFVPLKPEIVFKKIKDICKKENVEITKGGCDTIIKLAKGDMRKAINMLQAVNMSHNVIDENNVYSFSGLPNPNDVARIMTILLNKSLDEAFIEINSIKEEKGLSLMDIIKELGELVINIQLNSKQYIYIIKCLSDIERKLAIGASENIQLLSIISSFIHMREMKQNLILK